MKTPCTPRILLAALFLLLMVPETQGQLLKKLGKSAERAAERTVERRVERETQEKTDAALDSILEPGTAEGSVPPADLPGTGTPTSEGNTRPGAGGGTAETSPAGPKNLKIYTNYDFVAGDRLLLYEDFTVDNIGDFPARWNTNGSGEVVTLNNSPDKWLKLSNETTYVPDLPQPLPESYTLEFDMITSGLDKTTSSIARLRLLLDDNNSLRQGNNFAEMSIPLAQFIDAGIYVNNFFKGENTVRNYVIKDVRQDVLQLAHVAVAVNGQRYRMWMNERKLLDLPRFIEPDILKYVKFDLGGMNSETGGQFVFISNVKLAEGGLDLRSKLLKEGKFSTTGILFDSGMDKIKPESYGTLKSIAEALQQEAGMKVRILGHTDSDGSEASNLELSKKRSEAVRTALSQNFGIEAERLETDGKGEAAPVGDNATTEGKAQNRRVEFIKI